MAALTAALAAATIAQTASGVIGNRRNANAAIAQGNYEQGVNNLNAGYADQEATDAIARGREAELRAGTQTRVLGGTQRAALAASGVDPNVGSAAEIQAENSQLGALDALTIKNNAAREAYGYQVQAQGYRAGGAMAAAAGQNAAQGYRNQAASTLLTGSLQLASMFPNNKIPTKKPTPVSGPPPAMGY
jgi:hypothetical protein